MGIVIVGHSRAGHGAPADLGVLLFFVLSGFLITTLLVREHDSTGAIHKRAFYMRRTLRIFPAYYAFLLVSFLVDTVRHDPWTWGMIASSLTYTVDYYNAFLNHPSTTIAHCWSLAVEEQFYLLWPWVFVALWSRGRSMTISALILVILGTVGWRIFLYAQGVSHAYLYNAFECRADALAIGCLLAVVHTSSYWPLVVSKLAEAAWRPLGTIVLLVYSRLSTGAFYHYTWGFAVDAALCAMLMIQVIHLANSRWWSWLDSKPLKFLGVISYPCYLWHGWGMAVGEHLATNPWLVLAIGYVATIGLAYGSYRVIERPFLALKAKWATRSSPSALPALAHAVPRFEEA